MGQAREVVGTASHRESNAARIAYRCGGRVPGKVVQVGLGTCAGEDGCVSFSDLATMISLTKAAEMRSVYA
jgi:hypothetical protein